MKKHLVAAALTLAAACVLPTTLAAADMHLTGSVDGAVTLWSSFLMPSLTLTWQPEGFGAGGEILLPSNTRRGDTYLVALGLVKLGWLDLGAGLSAMVVPPSVDASQLSYPDGSVFIATRMGITAPLWQIGPGKLGLNASALLLITQEPSSLGLPEPTDLGEWIVRIIFYPFIWIVEYSADLVKFSGGLNYTVDL